MQKELRETNERLNHPANKFLNAKNEDGTPKYALAGVLEKYWLANPDPALNDIRLANSLVHELRFRKNVANKHYSAYQSKSPNETLMDNQGRLLSKDECYLAFVRETQAQHLVLLNLRDHLVSKLLAKCDGKTFTFEQYETFVNQCRMVVEELGFELFPHQVNLVAPL